ncbi:MAG: FAD-dependent oxidoreductase [Gammaproteobacteria bacterium]|nr:FAD-dependent oxidoreductase [Gammaproteobacteria bacterium]MDH5801852.1 FAD-dependent oxidoreductase [Gammaproteobacteria bacterium]
MTKLYDMVVIGAGIHGAGIAQAAAACGFSVLVLEKSQVAAGTSSRSSKLIHGGLRYLESGQISLVRECLRERAILCQIAPDLVQLSSFFIPVYKTTRRHRWQLHAGLGLYSLLAGLGPDSRYRTLPRCQWQHLDGLQTHDLLAVFEYKDGQTDDRLLTRAVMQSAQELGVELCLPARFQGAVTASEYSDISYEVAGQERYCRARVLVNAAGPWVNQVLQQVQPAMSPFAVDLVQGCHIIVPESLQRGVYYMEAPRDMRAVFAIPWKQQTLVGTTETPFSADTDTVHTLPEEVTYLQETLLHYFPDADTSVLESFAGLRVLPSGDGTAFHKPRETVLYLDNPHSPRVVHVIGGKLTAYRATSQKVLHKLLPSLPTARCVADTRELKLRV